MQQIQAQKTDKKQTRQVQHLIIGFGKGGKNYSY